MGRAKRTRQYGATKRLLNPKDDRLHLKAAAKADAAPIVHRSSDATKGAADATVQRSELFFSHNRALGPPFHVRFFCYSFFDRATSAERCRRWACAPREAIAVVC